MNRKDFLQISSIFSVGMMMPFTLKSNEKPIIDSFGWEAKYYPNLNFQKQSFSKSGSWLNINYKDVKKTHRIYIKTLRSVAVSYKWSEYWAGDYYQIGLYKNGAEVTYETKYLPWKLELTAKEGNATIAFLDDETIYFHSEGVDIGLLTMQGYFWKDPVTENHTILLPKEAKLYHHFKTTDETKLEFIENGSLGDKGEKHLDIQIIMSSGTNGSTFAFRETTEIKKWTEKLPDVNKVVYDAEKEVNDWMKKMPPVPQSIEASAKTAWFLLHAFQVKPSNYITRRTLLASKNSWLTKIWAWDHCFHAMVLAMGDPGLAWDQLFLFFDNQLDNGGFPEPLSDLMCDRGFTKPPIHGWTITKLIEIIGFDRCVPYLKDAYEPMCKFTNYWYEYHDNNKDGICHYRHGNDSGWDNATAYDQGTPTMGSDLSAYLVIQQNLLADIAKLKGKNNEASYWKERADKQLQLMLKNQVKNNRFISPLETNGTSAPCESLINYMPIMLGDKLPDTISKQLIADLQPGGNYLTNYGLASESIHSPKYEADGYWRGPIWAPPNYQIFSGLLKLNQKQLAKEIAVRYTNMCHADGDFHENYEAKTGKPLQAPGVSWTPAVFMLFAEWLARNS